MSDVLDCSPCYEGRPETEPGAPSALLITEASSRSRLFAGGTFFRSKLTVSGSSDFQGSLCNDISLSVVSAGTDFDLIVYFEGAEVERYSTTQSLSCSMVMPSSAIDELRTQTATSLYISMPARGTDEQDEDVMMLPPTDDPCLSFFSLTAMSGGAGPSEADVAAIRTGPERTIAYVEEIENGNGALISSRTLSQWNFDTLQWVAYVLDADCALPADRCP